MNLNVSGPGPDTLVARRAPFSGNSGVTLPAEQAGAGVAVGATATGGLVGTTTGGFVAAGAALVGTRVAVACLTTAAVTVLSGVTVAGWGVGETTM